MLQKHTINEIAKQAKLVLKQFNPVLNTVADTDTTYDVRINLKNKSSLPRILDFSYDKDVGYFIDLENVTWEFQHDEGAFCAESARLLKAIVEGKVRIEKKKFLGIIPIGDNCIIIE